MGQLKQREETWAAEVAAQARAKVVEVNNLKKALLSKMRETRDTLRLKTKFSLSQIAQRTLAEQQQCQRELRYCGQESEKLLSNNKQLAEENRRLRENAVLQSELESELSKRNSLYQRLIKKVAGQLRSKEEEIKKLGEEKGELEKDKQELEEKM